jgi:hypothetical protein
LTIVRAMIVMATTKGWFLHQMDVNTKYFPWRFTRRNVHGTTTRLCWLNTS